MFVILLKILHGAGKISFKKDHIAALYIILPDIVHYRFIYTANIFKVFFTVFNCVRLSTVVSLYGLHLIAAPSTIK